MYELADRRLGDAGFAWYEISNWARPGAESRHNLAYWLGRPWEAVGPGAHAFDGVTRRWNAGRLDAYLGALLAPGGGRPGLPPGGVDADAPTNHEGTAAILALRTRSGIPAAGAGMLAIAATVAWGLDTGLLERTLDDRVALTVRGRLLSDELFVRLA